MSEPRVLWIEAQAPAQPAPGAPCNGCGVCCLHEPCPFSRLLRGWRDGACRWLRWDAAQRRYRCQAVAEPQALLPVRGRALAPLLQRLARRWIGAGLGCDCTLQAQAADRAGRAN